MIGAQRFVELTVPVTVRVPVESDVPRALGAAWAVAGAIEALPLEPGEWPATIWSGVGEALAFVVDASGRRLEDLTGVDGWTECRRCRALAVPVVIEEGPVGRCGSCGLPLEGYEAGCDRCGACMDAGDRCGCGAG